MNTEISPRQERAVQLLAAGQTQIEAAKAAGVNERTLRSWNANPYFKAAVNAAKEAQLEGVRDSLRLTLDKATARLQSLLDSEDEAIALKAVAMLMDIAKPFDPQDGAGLSIGSTNPEHLTGTVMGMNAYISDEQTLLQDLQVLLERYVDGETDAATVERAVGAKIEKDMAELLIDTPERLQTLVSKILGLGKKGAKKANNHAV